MIKKFLQEFKDFATKGNVWDLAVGVIIGGAFQKIVTSAINDLIMPFIGLLTGKNSFQNWYIVLRYPDPLPEGISKEQIATSLLSANQAEATIFNYGAFFTALLDFLIMAFVIFLMIKSINKFKSIAKTELEKLEAKAVNSKEENEPAEAALPKVKTCPYCLSEIPSAAVKCAFCTSDVSPQFNSTEQEND